ncbi:MAG TPA: Coq4 family protein [Myxococcaceae bacterium]|nr:Coq4 family protein [Myxococcaceae bacterium]
MTSTTLPLPPDTSFLTRWRLGLQALMVLKDENASPEWARQLHLSLDDRTYDQLAGRMRKTPEGARLLDERPTVPGDIGFEGLSRLPEGTLGRTFADTYQVNGIMPFTYEYPVGSDGEYLYKRYRETHDIHHLLTGYGIDALGEVEIQAFYLGNLGLKHAGLIGVVSYPGALFRMKGLGQVSLAEHHRRMRAAYQRGKASPNVLALDFEAYWDRPMSELTAQLAPAA